MSLALILHALRAAQPRQLRARALRPLRRRVFPTPPRTSRFRPLEDGGALWLSPAFAPSALSGSGVATRLARFHRHYGEDALSLARKGDAEGVRRSIQGWIERNPPAVGDAWHPYPLSTRAGNWIAALSLEPGAVTERIEDSLGRQLAYLARNVEDDVLGNHVIRNARALVLGGSALGHPLWLDYGAVLLERELPQQVLADGGHYERSPSYHRLVLRDLLEVVAAAGVEFGPTIERMTVFATQSGRPDGHAALFNDGALDLSPDLELPDPERGVSIFAQTGYVFVREERLWLALDCGSPAPPYLPPHAHADALSFQLWVEGSPAVVDPGSYTYEPGRDRDWFRGTAAHATVQIDGRDQFELWGAFRAGPMPAVELLAARNGEMVAAVEWPDGIRHTRCVRWSQTGIEIDDRLDGSGRHLVESRIPLAPGAPVALVARPAPYELERGWLSERMFERQPIEIAVIRVEVELPTELGWTLRMAG